MNNNRGLTIIPNGMIIFDNPEYFPVKGVINSGKNACGLILPNGTSLYALNINNSNGKSSHILTFIEMIQTLFSGISETDERILDRILCISYSNECNEISKTELRQIMIKAPSKVTRYQYLKIKETIERAKSYKLDIELSGYINTVDPKTGIDTRHSGIYLNNSEEIDKMLDSFSDIIDPFGFGNERLTIIPDGMEIFTNEEYCPDLKNNNLGTRACGLILPNESTYALTITDFPSELKPCFTKETQIALLHNSLEIPKIAEDPMLDRVICVSFVNLAEKMDGKTRREIEIKTPAIVTSYQFSIIKEIIRRARMCNPSISLRGVINNKDPRTGNRIFTEHGSYAPCSTFSDEQIGKMISRHSETIIDPFEFSVDTITKQYEEIYR